MNKIPPFAIVQAIALIIFTGGAALPFVLGLFAIVGVVWLFGEMNNSNYSDSADEKQRRIPKDSFNRREDSVDRTKISSSASNYFYEEDDYEEESDGGFDYASWHIDRYGIAPQHIDEEHPLADSYDPDMGISFRDYCDMQGY